MDVQEEPKSEQQNTKDEAAPLAQSQNMEETIASLSISNVAAQSEPEVIITPVKTIDRRSSEDALEDSDFAVKDMVTEFKVSKDHMIIDSDVKITNETGKATQLDGTSISVLSINVTPPDNRNIPSTPTNTKSIDIHDSPSPLPLPTINHSPPPISGMARGMSRRFNFGTASSHDESAGSPPSPGTSFLRGFSQRFSILGASKSSEHAAESSLQPISESSSATQTTSGSLLVPSPSKPVGGSAKANTVQNSKVWNIMRSRVSLQGRPELERALRMTIHDPDMNVVVKLAHALIDSKHHSSSAAYAGALLMEWAIYRGFQCTPEEERLLGSAHAEVWLSRGMAAERYHLERAKALYESAINSATEHADASMWVEYSRVLSYYGETEAAANILRQTIANFDDDPDLSSYLFCLGAALKACEQHEEASNYFFEAAMIGPPKYFNKLQMMFIISRNIEEESRNSETGSDDAYLMVYQHLVMEGMLSADLTYEQWISDSNTWTALGEMCALHGAHSLACDLLGQGLMKDPKAFKKPKLWFAFAKACKRCGRTSDAQLAVKQSLTMQPFNQQLLRALELCSITTHQFEGLVESDLSDVLDLLPDSKMTGICGALKLQAVQRGKAERKSYRLGVGNRTDIKQKMQARCGVLLGGIHPILLTAKATWIGSISEIIATDVDGRTARLKLQNPFTPIKETGIPRKLILTLTAMPDDQYDRHTIVMRFTDQLTQEYLQRTLTLSFREHDKEGHLLHIVHRVGQKEDEETSKAAEQHATAEWTLMESLRFKDDHDIITNIVDVEVERGSFVHHSVCYFYHVSNQEQNTMVKLYQVVSDRQIVFQMQREHLDRNKDFKRKVIGLMEIVHAYPRLHAILHGEKRNRADDEATNESPDGFWHNTHGNREGIIFHGKLVLVRIMPEVHGETFVRLFEANGYPLLGHAIEDVDSAALKQDLPSRAKRQLREQAVSAVKMRLNPDDQSGPLFLAPIEAVVTAESLTPREEPESESHPKELVDALKEALSDSLDDDNDNDNSSTPTKLPLSRMERTRVKQIMLDASFDSGISGSTPPSPGSFSGRVAFSDEPSGIFDPDAADHQSDEGASVEDPLRSKKMSRKKKKHAKEAEGDGQKPSPTAEASSATPQFIINKKSKKDSMEKKVLQAAQPVMKARFVAQPMGRAASKSREETPEQAERARRQREDAKKAKEMAAQATLRYMEHQTNVNEAKEYILDRARKAQWNVGQLDARPYLLERAARAKRLYADMLAALAAQEAADLASAKKREEDEAYEAAKQTAMKIKDAKGGIRGSIKGKSVQKPTRKSLISKRGSKDEYESSFLDGYDDVKQSYDASDEVGESETGGSWERDDVNEKDDAVSLEGVDETAKPDESIPEEIVREVPEEEPSEEDDLLAGFVEPPKKVRLTIPKAREAPSRPPKKITINHPPALTSKQKNSLRRQWGASDLPMWAYDSPAGLVAALQHYGDSTSAVGSFSGYDPFSSGVSEQIELHSEDISMGYFEGSYPRAEKADIAVALTAPAPVESPPSLSTPSSPEPSINQVIIPIDAEGEHEKDIAEIARQDDANVQLLDGCTDPEQRSFIEALSTDAVTADPASSDKPVVVQFQDSARDVVSQPMAAPTVSSKADLPAHLVALLDPGLIRGSKGLASGENMNLLRKLASRLNKRDVEYIAIPLPINASDNNTAFKKDSLFEVSVTTDRKMEAFKRQQRKTQLLSSLDTVGVAGSPGKKPRFLTGTGSSGTEANSVQPLYSVRYPMKAPMYTHSASPFDPPRPYNPVGFLESSLEANSLDAGSAAIEAYLSMGYADGSSPYTSLWRQKLTNCLGLFPDPSALKKSIASLQKSCPQQVSKLEAFCALADSQGSASEALGRLGDVEFYREVKTVCVMLPVESILTKFAGNYSVYSAESSRVYGASAQTQGTRSPRPFKTVSNCPHLRDLRGVITATPTLNELQLEATAGVRLEPVGSDNEATGSPSVIRIAGTDSRRLLPHLNMQQGSSFVQSRGTTIRLPGKADPPHIQPRVSPLSAAGLGMGIEPEPSLYGGSISTMVTDPRYATIFPGGGSVDYSSEAKQESLDMSQRRKEIMFMAVDSNNKVAPIVPYSKSMRLASAIDVLYEQAPTSMVVMCRRDAIRAAGELTLSRSPHKKLRQAAEKRSKAWERYSEKLASLGDNE